MLQREVWPQLLLTLWSCSFPTPSEYVDSEDFLIFNFLGGCTWAYGSSQARGWIRSVAAGLHPATATPDLSTVWRLHPAHGNAISLMNWGWLGIELASSWILFRYLTHWATMGTPKSDILKVPPSLDYWKVQWSNHGKIYLSAIVFINGHLSVWRSMLGNSPG